MTAPLPANMVRRFGVVTPLTVTDEAGRAGFIAAPTALQKFCWNTGDDAVATVTPATDCFTLTFAIVTAPALDGRMEGAAVGFCDRVGRDVAPGMGMPVGRRLVGRCVGRSVEGLAVGRRLLGRGVGPYDGDPAGTVGAGVRFVGFGVGLRVDVGRAVVGLLTGLVVVASVAADEPTLGDECCVGWLLAGRTGGLLPRNAVGWHVVVNTVGWNVGGELVG